MDKMWLLDESLIKRSFAVAGYQLLATLMIYACVFIVMAIFGGVGLMLGM